MRLSFCAFFCSVFLIACGPSTEVLMLEGTSGARSSVPPSQVAVYQNVSELACDHQRVALIESQDSKETPFGSGVSRIELIRAARTKAGAIGANALIVETLGLESFIETEVTADSASYERRESRQSWGQGMFLAVHEDRPCTTAEGGERPPSGSLSGLGVPIVVTDVEPRVTESLSLPSGAKRVVASEVTGLGPGDVILSVDGAELVQKRSLEQILSLHAPGEMLQIEIFRKGTSKTVTVTVRENTEK